MRGSTLYDNKSIPAEYRKAAEKLFPPKGFPAGKGPEPAAAAAFAEILGIAADYQRLLKASKTGEELRHFLEHFQNNLDLLIRKTWVEKADEIRKEKLEDRLPSFIEEIEQGDLQKALRHFGVILEELAYLFFGAQSTHEDFIEYALRIDIQMGLFWWYGGQLLRYVETNCHGDKNGGTAGKPADPGDLWPVLLIGICYLTDF
ncbi:MAG: hypothetical protein LBT87_03070 [Treponema sp.]|jgi:hypothetical protein|nr:hypothetical protein [Treponema sp.]